VRWDALFADLEAAADAEQRLEYEAEVVEQARAEYAAVHLVDRLRAHAGRPLRCHLVDGQRLEGRVGEVGQQWLLLQTPGGYLAYGEVLVPVRALAGVDGLTRSVAPPNGELARRIGLGVVLRGLAVRRVPVRLMLSGGGVLTGTIDRVGADHLDLAEHAPDVPRRSVAVVGVRLVPFPAVMAVYLGPTWTAAPLG
jgi:hypothetical protein